MEREACIKERIRMYILFIVYKWDLISLYGRIGDRIWAIGKHGSEQSQLFLVMQTQLAGRISSQ